MKILHIVPSYKPAYVYGGTIESVARLCEGLVNTGVDVTVFTTTANGQTELDVRANEMYTVEGVKVIYCKRFFKDHVYISPWLWKRLYHDCKQYDVVHIHSWWNILVLISALICKLKRVKTIISPHGMLSDYILNNSNSFFKKFTHAVIGRALLRSAIFHATSEAEYTECKKLIPGWKGFVLPNLVWLPQLHIAKPVNKNFTLIFLSRIHPKKGIELLMDAISLMKERPLLKIAGTGNEDYIKKLKEKARELGIDNSIEWQGWKSREDKFQDLMEADLLVLTSFNENFANVIIEGLHTGTPVLISDKVGLYRFVEEYKLGWICKTNAEDIQHKLQDAVSDKEKRSRIAVNAPIIVKQYLSEERILPQYLVYYNELF